MPYVNNKGVRIHYQVVGQGPPLVMHHGFGGFLETWHDMGYVEALEGDYQLVLMDSRGCGASDKPHDRESYRLERRVGDVVAVLDDLNIARAHFFGYSMGAYIGWGIAQYAPRRFASLILGGGAPPEQTYDEAEAGPGPMQKTLRQGRDAWVALVETAFGPWWQPQWKPRVLASDMEALIAMASRWEAVDYDGVLSTLEVPCLVLVGEKDGAYPGARRVSEILPHATFVSFAGLGHDALCRTDLVVPQIRAFLANVSGP